MATKKKPETMKKVPRTRVKIFRIANRRGYAAIVGACLTEGSTSYQAYDRLRKACRRIGDDLQESTAAQVKRLVRKGL